MNGDLFSQLQPLLDCPACKGQFRVGCGITDALWQKIRRKDDPEHSELACANCVIERLADLERYPVIRMAVLADNEIVDAIAHGRRQGWLSFTERLEECGHQFLPMTTVLEMMEKEPDGSYKFMCGLNVPLKQVFKDYADEFYRMIDKLKADIPPGGLEDRITADSAPMDSRGS